MRKVWKILWLAVVFLASLNVLAQEIKLLKAETPFVFANDQAIEPSAVEPIGNGKFLLVADDKDVKGKSLKIVEAATGKVLKTLDKLQIAEKNPKWEALAKDELGNYFVIGSHNDEADAEKLASRSLMFSFRLKKENETVGTSIEIDKTSIKPLNVTDSLISIGLYNAVPTKTKAKIEGLTVKTNNCQTKIIIGLREPSNVVQIYSATIQSDELKTNSLFKLSLKPFFQFNAGKTSDNTEYKLSSIEYVDKIKGFLVTTSTETTVNGKPVFHGNALWFISNEKIENAQPKLFNETYKLAIAQKIMDFEPTMKVEGLCKINSQDEKILRLALMFDNDTKDSAQLGKMQFVNLEVKK